MLGDADRGVRAPEPECRRDWVPVEALKCRRSRKCEDEPVRCDVTGEPGPAAGDERRDIEVAPDRADVRSLSGGGVDA